MNLDRPVTSGTAQVGQTLTAPTYSYQWNRFPGGAIPNAVAKTYVPTTVDIGKTLSVTVASFVAGEQATFPVYLYSQLRLPERLPSVIAVAVVILVVSVIVVVGSEVGRFVAERRLEAQTGVKMEELGSLRSGKG